MVENDIQMVDLKRQYDKIKTEIDQGIQSIIDSTAFVKGQEVKKFEGKMSDYLQVKNSIACGNGTDALQIALMALDLKPGDEVITSTFTFIATVEVIALLGLTPKLIDVNPDTFLMEPHAIEKAITSKTKAIIPVHLFGQCADMDQIMDIAHKHHLYVVEDAAQSFGSKYKSKFSGGIGDIGCTSFFPSKNLGAFGDGGAIFTNNDAFAEKIRAIANHGMKKRYHHDMIGVNSRLDGIQAAILNVKIKFLDKYNKARQTAADYYSEKLRNINEIEVPVHAANSTHVYHQYTIKIRNGIRDKLQDFLKENNIPSMVYYPIPLHKQKAFEIFGTSKDQFPNSEKISDEVLSLPMHTELDADQQGFIVKTIKDFFNH